MTSKAASPVVRAAAKWNGAEGERFEFGILAEPIVGSKPLGEANSEVHELATMINRSVSTVYDFAHIGRLWKGVIQRWPSQGEVLRADVSLGFWEAVARLYSKGMPLVECKEWLERAQGDDIILEEFRKQLPRAGEPNPFRRWLKKLSEWSAHLWSLTDKMDISFDRRKAARDAAEALTRAHEAMERLERTE